MANHGACCTPSPPSEHGSLGKEVECCGLDLYMNWPAGATSAVLLASDVFGWKKPLLRKFADKVAAAGFIVVIPDFFKGDPLDSGKYAFNGEGFQEWIAMHPVDGAVVDTLTVIKGLKDKGVTSFGLAGFCYGGKVAVLLAKDGLLDATVLLHPSLVTLEDIKALKGPLSILAAEIDQTTPVELVEEFRKYLESQNEVEYFVKINPGVSHGWTVRYDENDEKAVAAAEEAHLDAINWFKKFLK